jgi:hypothetical protein
MKTFNFKPGFEFIFALSLTAILGLPPVLLAQVQKDVEIKIENGDTTVNGKNIRDLSQAERQNALKDINHLNGGASINSDDERRGKDRQMYFFKRTDSADKGYGRMEFRKRIEKNGDRDPLITGNIVIRDSLGNIVRLRSRERRPMENNFMYRFRNDDEMPDRMEMPGEGFGRPFNGSPMMRFERRNTQNFDYRNTDNEGISTHVSFRVSDASNNDLKKMSRIEGAKFEISDLNIVPEFTSGKILLMFNLPAKSIAEVKLSDSTGKILWSEKAAGGSFSKTFALGLNGIYYLQVKQGNSVAAKRIVKEE